jgi:nitrate/nitrite-specific signal transduction histidine kinase
MPHNRSSIQISFGAINFSLGENLRFQYKLEGSDQDWSAPSADRSVNYARLSPGSYRFTVRAVDENGIIGKSPASVDFNILNPFWRQWWFVAAIALIATLLINSLYRIRIERLLEIEKIRTRIASDLHDDIGSSLSRIAILTETVRRHANGNPGIASLLTNMADASREAIDAMADIVWAVNPKKDQLRDLESRMRHLAGEMLSDRKANFDSSTRQTQESCILNPDLKRNVFLIFKECLHNIVRHSESSMINIRLDLKDGFLFLEIQDNGKGFDPSAIFEGLGLRNIKKRAAELNANLDILSKPGNGALVRLQTPLSENRIFGKI